MAAPQRSMSSDVRASAQRPGSAAAAAGSGVSGPLVRQPLLLSAAAVAAGREHQRAVLSQEIRGVHGELDDLKRDVSGLHEKIDALLDRAAAVAPVVPAAVQPEDNANAARELYVRHRH